MKTVSRIMAALLVAGCTAGYALDNNPLSAGATQNRNVIGTASEAPNSNPALLGVDRAPRGGLLIVPFTNYGVAAWSDKLALNPFYDYYGAATDTTKKQMSSLLAKIMRQSFDIGVNDAPDVVSQKMTDALKGGVTTFVGYRMTWLNFAAGAFAFDVTTHIEEEMHIPEGPLFTFFSATEGLLRGNTLDFSSFRQSGMAATDVTLSLGLPVNIPALHRFFNLKYGAGGVGIKYIMGHGFLNAQMSNGSVTYDTLSGNNRLMVKGDMSIQTAGMGLHGPWKVKEGGPFADKNYFPINGHGFAADLGGILYDEHGTLTINFQNVGVIFWIKEVKEVKYKINKDNLTAYDIINGIDQGGSGNDQLLHVFNKTGDEISGAEDTLMQSSGVTTVLPITANLGYTYKWDYSKKGYFTDYCNVGANYEQCLARGPGRSLVPRLSLGAEAGFLYGFLPLRMGFVFGGPELIASALGGSWNFKYFSINLAYKGMGTLYFVPKRGMELAFGMGYNWGYPKPPPVVLDTSHPIFDHDHDGIMDSVDICPTIPEDKDGYQDEDGCPDYDNDRDGMPDTLDKCPNFPEDIDGFQDADGCPDYDNDRDDTPDTLDKCLNVPEDVDGFQDTDGCPDPDNDNDGIPDTLDKCVFEPETYNGYKDDDGCPDTLIKPTQKEMITLNTKLRDINFKTASAELLPASFAALDYATGFLKQYPLFKYEIQGHCDSRGSDDYNMVLSAARVGSVKAYLISKGIPDSMLAAIGYGESRPIADNRTAAGRALNRRVEFHFIETPADYSALKMQEQMFRERIRDMKIKGAAQY